MKRAWVALVVLGIAGCKDKAKDVRPADKGSAASAPLATDKPPVKIDGPAVTPVVTNSITFFVPKDAPWWGEMAFGCYAGAITLQPGNTPSAPFTKISPAVEPAMRAADIDLDKDLGAIGAWGCGDGPCIYVALTLRHPEKLKDMLAALVPGATPKELGKNHYTIDAPGAQGARTVHMQAVPIQWPAKLPTDTWSRQAAAATHVVFITGLFGKTSELGDALAAGADPQTAAARVADVESIVPDAHGRCVLGHVGKREFQPGYQLTNSRFVLAAPEGKGDPLTQMLGSLRTLDLEVELVLDPAPNEKKVADWIAQARAWMSAIGDQVRAGFGGGGPMVDAMYDMAGLLGKSGFRHTLKDKSLTLSFRTDRISSAELSTIETQLESAMKAQGISP